MDITHAKERPWAFRERRRSARSRRYVGRHAKRPAESPPTRPQLSVLTRVLDGLRSLPERPGAPASSHRDERTASERGTGAEQSRTAVDRTPTEEIPVVNEEVHRR